MTDNYGPAEAAGGPPAYIATEAPTNPTPGTVWQDQTPADPRRPWRYFDGASWVPTTKRELETLAVAAQAAAYGVTWSELARDYGWHHGQASAALSTLHRAGRLAALTDKRGRQTVYVLPEHVAGRPTRKPGRNRPAEADALTEAYDKGYTAGWNALRDMQRGY
jgi:hypothetical protein